MRAYVRWNRVSRLDDPVGWIRHVAVNRMRDHFRKLERGNRAFTRLRHRDPLVTEAPKEPSQLEELLAQLPRPTAARGRALLRRRPQRQRHRPRHGPQRRGREVPPARRPDHVARRAGAAAMSPNDFDDIDRALASGLAALAPEVEGGDETLASLRPRFQRARTRNRAMKAGGAIAVLVVIASVAAMAAPSSRRSHVQVSSPPTTPAKISKPARTSTTSTPTTTVPHVTPPTPTTVPSSIPSRSHPFVPPFTPPATSPPTTARRAAASRATARRPRRRPRSTRTRYASRAEPSGCGSRTAPSPSSRCARADIT